MIKQNKFAAQQMSVMTCSVSFSLLEVFLALLMHEWILSMSWHETFLFKSFCIQWWWGQGDYGWKMYRDISISCQSNMQITSKLMMWHFLFYPLELYTHFLLSLQPVHFYFKQSWGTVANMKLLPQTQAYCVYSVEFADSVLTVRKQLRFHTPGYRFAYILL